MLILRRTQIEVDCVRKKTITFDRVSSGSAGSTIECLRSSYEKELFITYCVWVKTSL